MIDKKTVENICHDLFHWFFVMLVIFVVLEWRYAGFVIGYINLSWWFLATLVFGGAYLSLKNNN